MKKVMLDKFSPDQLLLVGRSFPSIFLNLVGFFDIEYLDAFRVEKIDKLQSVVCNGNDYLIVGKIFGDFIYVDRLQGCVYRMDVDELQFLNSSLQLFFFSAIEYILFLERSGSLLNQEIVIEFGVLWERLIRIDQKLSTEGESFWKIFIDDNLEIVKSEVR